jgi:hypothetical protein
VFAVFVAAALRLYPLSHPYVHPDLQEALASNAMASLARGT